MGRNTPIDKGWGLGREAGAADEDYGRGQLDLGLWNLSHPLDPSVSAEAPAGHATVVGVGLVKPGRSREGRGFQEGGLPGGRGLGDSGSTGRSKPLMTVPEKLGSATRSPGAVGPPTT